MQNMSCDSWPGDLKDVFGRTNERSCTDQLSWSTSRRNFRDKAENTVKPLVLMTAVPIEVI
jgi:hypothetical protein